MREKWEIWKEELDDVTTMSRREFLLTVAVCILGGIVLGFVFSPRRETTIGSYNGNNNNGEFGTSDEKDDDEKKENKSVATEKSYVTLSE